MKKFFRRTNLIIKAVYFILAIILIVFIYPKEGKFRYDFQKGRPWKHENLFTSFDFGINKSNDEIQNEKDSLVKQVLPFFKINKQVFKNQEKSLIIDLDKKWKDHVNTFFRISNSKIFTEDEDNSRLKDKYYLYLDSLLKIVYNTGIIENNLYSNLNFPDNSLIILQDKFAEEYSLDDIFDVISAKEFIENKITEIKADKGYISNLNYVFLKTIKIEDYIKPNLELDNKTYKEAKEQSVELISLTYGMVQKGELIISRGEIVNDELYRILSSLKTEYEYRTGNMSFVYLIIGQSLVVSIAVLMLFLFIVNFKRRILQSNTKTLFILVLFVLFVLLGVLVVRQNFINIYLIPFALIPIIISTFYDSRTALFINLITVLLVGFIVPNAFEFVLMQVFAGFVSILSVKGLYKRSQIFLSSFLVFLTYSLVFVAISVIQESSLADIEWKMLAWFGGNALLILAAAPIIYIFEKTFGFLSDLTLMELSGANQPLLRELAEKAPGTFQHSMQVANLAEDAIRKIGGNPLLVRCGALYHDIGKTEVPQYFIENQGTGGNPHDKLEFDKSAELIISHVTLGIKKAKKHGLPTQIIDFIRTHHGNSKAWYFYKSQKNKYPDKEIDDSLFTYPGPNPHTKETVVLMMADAVEAASRSLKVITEEEFTKLIEGIVNFQMGEKLYNNANINFNDIAIVKDSFKKKLLSIYHARIEYPE